MNHRTSYRDLGCVVTEKEEREITAPFAAGRALALVGAGAFGLRANARMP